MATILVVDHHPVNRDLVATFTEASLLTKLSQVITTPS